MKDRIPVALEEGLAVACMALLVAITLLNGKRFSSLRASREACR